MLILAQQTVVNLRSSCSDTMLAVTSSANQATESGGDVIIVVTIIVFILIGCRLWNLSLISVLILTFSNILLTIRLLHNNDCPRHLLQERPPPPHSEEPAPVPCKTITEPSPNITTTERQEEKRELEVATLDVDLRLGRWDARHMFKMFDQALVGERFAELSDKFSVCLATQSSLEKLYSLVQVAHHWTGPISAAVFASGPDELRLLKYYIRFLRRCYASVRERVSFHLAYPNERPPGHVPREPVNVRLDCLRPESSLTKLVKMRLKETVKWRARYAYPQNHMRNLARRNCQGRFVFLTDVDIVPSAHLAEGLDTFLRASQCKKLCAYVIPTYEIDERVRFPRNKTDLIRLARKGLARPFHHKVFIYNQFATNFSRWENVKNEKEAVHISHDVTNFEFLYEPFYVAPDTVPGHDERFIGYGYTRNTQVYEMFVAGYQFQVLSPLFTCHWGLQNKKGRPSWRERQNSMNRRHFDVFKSEVFARYRKDPLKMVQPKKPAAGSSSGR